MSKLLFAGIGMLVLAAVNALLVGWVLMLLLGAVWHELGWGAPIGFWPAVGIGALLSIFWGVLTRSGR